jgi:mono/diheme cytochrome c family protein
MSVSMRPALFGVAVLTGAAALAIAASGSAQTPRNASAGAYTADQAASGAKAFADNCSACHGVDYTGGAGAPSLKGPEFIFSWGGKTAAQLFSYIHDNMPPGQAGSLSDQQYTEIVATLLNANGYPAGTEPLPLGTAAASVTINK